MAVVAATRDDQILEGKFYRASLDFLHIQNDSIEVHPLNGAADIVLCVVVGYAIATFHLIYLFLKLLDLMSRM